MGRLDLQVNQQTILCYVIAKEADILCRYYINEITLPTIWKEPKYKWTNLAKLKQKYINKLKTCKKYHKKMSIYVKTVLIIYMLLSL